MRIVINDGGRRAAGFRGKAGDCVCRAIAIATQRPYAEVYAALSQGQGSQRVTKRSGPRRATAANGVSVRRLWFKDYMRGLGFEWTPTMQIGSGCKVHLRAEELPTGRLVVVVSGHYTAVLDGVLHDTYDCTRAGTRCVYGYWRLAA
jgi:hypothetical protein